MAISKELIRNLKAEYSRQDRKAERLEKEARSAREDAEAIGQVLARFGQEDVAHKSKPVNTVQAPGDAPKFQTTVMQIIEEADRGFRPAEMVQALEGRFQDSSSSSEPLPKRVANTLARLNREEKIGKDADGRYASLARLARLKAKKPLQLGSGEVDLDR